jgi:hypothetical protein
MSVKDSSSLSLLAFPLPLSSHERRLLNCFEDDGDISSSARLLLGESKEEVDLEGEDQKTLVGANEN